MPGTEAFAHLVLFLTFGATLWGGFIAGPRRILPFLVFLGPMFLPAHAHYALPGVPDLSRTTAVTIPALALLLFTPSSCWKRFKLAWPDLLLVAFVGWAVICVAVNQGAWSASSQLAMQTLVLVMPILIGRLYVHEDSDLLALVKAVTPLVAVYLVLMLFEARFYPRLQGWIYGEDVLGLYRGGFYRPVVFMQNALELGHMMCLLAVMLYALWRTDRRRTHGTRTLDVGLFCSLAGVAVCFSRGPIIALALGLLVPRILRRPAFVSCLLGLAGVLFYFWMMGPSGSGLLVGAALTDDSATGQSLFYRFLQIEAFKPMVESSPIFGLGETWEREGPIKIIDGVLLLATLAFGYPGAILLSAFWLSCIWVIGRRAPRSDDMFGMLGVHLAPVIGFLVFSSWGDSFVRAPHYLLLGALVGVLSGKRVATGQTAGVETQPGVRRLVLHAG